MIEMSRRWKLVLAGALVAMLSGGVALAATSSSPPSTSTSPGSSSGPSTGDKGSDRAHGWLRHRLFRNLSNAELNVMIDGTEHTIHIDRGTVQSVSSTQLVLKELDGSTVTVPVSADTKVMVNGQEASISSVETGYLALAIRDGDNPAKAVRAHDPSLASGADSNGAASNTGA